MYPPSCVNTVHDAIWEQMPAGARPEHFDDQLEMYDALNVPAPASLTEDSLTTYYKSAALGVAPTDIVRTYSPRAGVTIARDRFGVPHVYGDTDADTEFGAGYAGTEDRMFLQDVLRHVGAARSAEFLGPSDANAAMDQEPLRAAYYTEEEAAAQDEQVGEALAEPDDQVEQRPPRGGRPRAGTRG